VTANSLAVGSTTPITTQDFVSNVSRRRRRPRGGPEQESRAGRLATYVVTVLLTLIFIFPLIWMVLTSLKPLPQAVSYPPVWWPHPFLFSNYPNSLASEPFLGYFGWTFYYGITTVIGVVVSSSLVAYGFSCLEWKGRDQIFYVMVATLLLPFVVTLIPLFVLYKDIGWVGSYKPLVIPTFFGSSVFSTFLLRQFFMGIPGPLLDAGRIDGASEFYIYRRIVLPLAKPALASVALFQFIYAWNDFLGPLIYISKASLYPISIGLDEFLGQYTTNWSWLMAATAVAMLPVVVLFFLTQRYFVEGVTVTGLK
jgi:multiple sugar transport system permease protein